MNVLPWFLPSFVRRWAEDLIDAACNAWPDDEEEAEA